MAERFRGAFLKPAPASASGTNRATPPRPVAELQAAVRSADDKERMIGLAAAPAAGVIGLLIINALIANDPPSLLANGQHNKLHVSLALYHELFVVLGLLAVVMLALALLRKRLYLGIVMALYGLAVFNLHYWLFGVPFLMVGSWLIVNAYRLQRELREATESQSAAARRRRR